MTVLLLPFAALHQDEATAKLCRQIPRLLGAELERALAAHEVTVRFLSSRGTTETGVAGLVASLELPAPSDLETMSRMYGADLVLSGKFGLTETNLILESRLFDATQNVEVYAKHFETYPTYFFDSIEEIKVRIVQALRIDLTGDERVRLMSRATDSWEALLYYLLAEDDRYALTLGLTLADPQSTLNLFRDALRIDADFALARTGMEHFLVLLIENGLIEGLKDILQTYKPVLSPEFVTALGELT